LQAVEAKINVSPYFNTIKKRIGRIKISTQTLLENPELILSHIMPKMIVLEAKPYSDYFEYIWISTHFPVSNDGNAKDLEVIVYQDDKGIVTGVGFKERQ
jgi:hypothetical protein